MRIAPHRREMLRASHASSFHERERGFSIVEIMIVLAIIAVLALAAAPWFAKISQRNEVRSAGSELAITLAAARMRAVKRNLPARVVITRNTGAQGFHLLETFEEVQPTAIKVQEGRISARVDFPPSPIASPYPYPNNANIITFGPDGRLAGAGPFPLTVTIRGPVNAGTQNDLPVQISANGKIEVLKPNPTATQLRGTEWH